MKPRFLNVTGLAIGLSASLASSGAFAADGSAEAPFRFYSVADGLTQSVVYDIDQDRAGYLWFTTARGLNRFDGREFDSLTIVDGLPSNTLTALEVDADNTLWVGDARGGVSIVRGGRVVDTVAPIGGLSSPISDIKIADGRPYVVAEGRGVLQVRMQDDGFALHPLAGEDIEARHLAVVGDEIWVSTSSR